MARERLTEEQLREVKRLLDDHVPMRQIAKRLGVAKPELHFAIKAKGWSCAEQDGDMRKATIKRAEQTAEKRRALELALLEDAARLREQLWEPHQVFNFGGKDNTFASRTIDEPTAQDKLRLMQAATNALNGSLRIAEFDGGSNVQTVNLILATAQALGLEGDGD